MKIEGFEPAIADRSQLWSLGQDRIYLCDRGDAGDPREPLDPLDPRGPGGEGAPALLLLHGLLVHHHEFAKIIPALARDRRVLAPDLFGCGESDAPAPEEAEGYAIEWHARALCRLLDRLGVAVVDVVGHSYGAAVALCLAAREPARVRRLALVDAVAFSLPLPIEGRLALLPGIGPALFKTLYRRADLRRYFGRVYADEGLIDEDSVDLYWDRLSRPGAREAAYAMLTQLVDLDPLGARIDQVEAPTLIVWGSEDQVVPLEHGRRLAARLGGATLEVIEGSGHAPNEERPAALVAALRRHFGGA